MMIGPEQGKKGSGKPGKKKDKAKKAKRHVADVDPGVPLAAETPEPVASERHDGAAEAPALAAPPAFGPPLLAWIDRVQERIDHLLTLTDVPAETPPVEADAITDPGATDAARPDATAPAAPPSSGLTVSAPVDPPTTEPAATSPATESAEDEAHRLSLAEAWARRLEASEAQAPETADDDPEAADEPALDEPVPAPDEQDEPADDEPAPDEHDDEPFEPVAARLSAVLVARELIARGVTPTDVRQRLRDGYGVDDPDAVLSRVVAA